ncbi:MAG: FtsX-like permease family protein, partial [Gemmatimonadetes bacterium]|nr:FtsX-like permease family protein [Gemmatimonadota bacterium]
LLVIACANVSNLLLARAAARRQEISVRLALGAGRVRLVQQFVAEALVLSLASAVVGLLLAWWGVSLLRALQPQGLPRLADVRVSGGVFAFALATAVLTAGALGALTALQAVRGDLRSALAQGQRTLSGGSGRRVRDALVVMQVALTLVLLVGAGLLGHSFLRLLSVDTGYRTRGGVVLDLALDEADDPGAGARTSAFEEELMRRLRAIPGVAEVGGVNDFPLGGNYSNGTFLVLSRPDEVSSFEDFGRLAKEQTGNNGAEYRVASEGYFRAMGIPLLRGRGFGPGDGPDAPHVALVSRSLARMRWPGEDPIGKLVQFGNMDGDLHPFTIVGVVGDIREAAVDAEPHPTLYGFSRQRTRSLSHFHVVMQGPIAPAAMIAPARRILREMAPEVPPAFRTLDEVFAASLADRRFSLLLLATFGGVALLLAMLGIYGVVSYLVAQRTREIGIRMAFGARAGDVARLVVRHGAALAGAGIGVGLLAALAIERLVAGMLYGVSATDPAAFAGVALLLAAVALSASWIPARRATRVDPMVALRE